MSLQHLSDEELNTLSSQGLPGLSDDALQRISLPEGYAHPGTDSSMLSKVGSAVGNVASKAVNGATDLAQKESEVVPGLQPLKDIGDLGKLAQAGAQRLRDMSQGGPLEMFGNMLGGYEPNDSAGSGFSAMLPNNALGASLALAPLASEGLASMAKDMAPEASGSLFSGKTAKNVAAFMKAESGTPEMSLRSAMGDPSMLKPGPSSQEIGDRINQFASQPEFGGLKTGSDARAKMSSVQGEISPRTGTGHAEANETWKRLGEIEERSARVGDLRDRFKNAGQIAEDTNNGLMQAYGNYQKSQPPSDKVTELLRTQGTPPTQTVDNGIAEQHAFNSMVQPEGIRGQVLSEMGTLRPQLQKDLQDLISARSVAASLRSAPGLAAPTEVVDTKLATQNMNRIDDAIANTMDSLKAGSGDQYKGLVDQYHRAKVRESFAPLFAQNANGSPSVLRIMAATMGPGSPLGKAGALTIQSPAMQARAIRAAAFLKDLALNAPSKALGAASTLSKAGTALVGPLNSLMAKKDDQSNQEGN